MSQFMFATGVENSYPAIEWKGMTRDEYHWFLQHHERSHCVMGNDYCEANENPVHADGSISLISQWRGTLPAESSVLGICP